MRLHLHEWGDPAAPTLVCLHGVTAHGERFAGSRESGSRSGSTSSHPTCAATAARAGSRRGRSSTHLDDLLETVPEDARLWVGHSFGGRLVLELAARRRSGSTAPSCSTRRSGCRRRMRSSRRRTPRADRSYASVEEAVDARLAGGSIHGAPRALLEEDFRAHLAAGEDGRLRLRFCPQRRDRRVGRDEPHAAAAALAVPLLVARARRGRDLPAGPARRLPRDRRRAARDGGAPRRPHRHVGRARRDRRRDRAVPRLEDPRAERARDELDREPARSRSPGRAPGSPRRPRASRAGRTRPRARARGAPRGS